MSWTVADIPDLNGRVAVVTGANGGLGLETARALAGAGAHVVMAARDQTKALAARDDIMNGRPRGSTEVVSLDLASLRSIETAASEIVGFHPKIDLLINNAGLMAMPEQRTEDWFEMQLGVNHLGHWALTARLMPALVAAGASRVVTVTSFARLGGQPVDPANPHLKGVYEPWSAYGQSKLANFHFAIGLQRDFERRDMTVSSLAAHPGLSHTDLQVRTVDEGGAGTTAAFWKWLAANFGMSPDRGALPQLRAGTDPRAKGGELYGPRFLGFGAAVRRPIIDHRGMEESIDTLWEVSRKETGTGLFEHLAGAAH